MNLINPSPTLAISDQARSLSAEGLDVISLSAGEPDFDTPDYIKDAAIEAIKAGKTKYTNVDGTAELKKAIVEKFKRENDLTYDVNQISVGAGAKQCLYNLMMSTLNAGDEVIVPSPYWVSYPDIVKISGGKPVFVECLKNDDFKIKPEQLEKAITYKTKWLIINSPSNPTGSVYTIEELKNLASVLLKYKNVNVVTDDIYEHIIYDNTKFFTIAQAEPRLYNRVFTVNGVSKAYSMTGWRIGYIAGNPEIINAMSTIQSQSTTNPNSIAQSATVTALKGDQNFLKERSKIFENRRNLLIENLSKIKGLEITIPKGAFYMFISCEAMLNKKTTEGKVIKNDLDFSRYLLDQYLVAVVSGDAFGAKGFFRISFATSEKKLITAIERIHKACQSLN